MTHRTFDEQMANFNRVVSSWDINQEYKVALLGMIASLGYEHEKSITPEPHWIPVEQELPEYGVDCIVSVKQKYTWQTDWEYFVDLGWRGDYIDGVWDTANDWDEGQETHISAWMPLPEPYKGVTE